MSWHSIVFVQGEEADKVFEMLYEIDGVLWSGPYAETIERTVEHLSQWDSGEESEHSPTDEPQFGSESRTAEHNGYTLAWDTHMGCLSLNRETKEVPA